MNQEVTLTVREHKRVKGLSEPVVGRITAAKLATSGSSLSARCAVVTELSDTASTWPNAFRIPAEGLAVPPQRVADRIWSLLQCPRRVAYVPALLRLVPWVELTFGGLIDRIGPLLLRRQLRLAARPVKVWPGRAVHRIPEDKRQAVPAGSAGRCAQALPAPACRLTGWPHVLRESRPAAAETRFRRCRPWRATAAAVARRALLPSPGHLLRPERPRTAAPRTSPGAKDDQARTRPPRRPAAGCRVRAAQRLTSRPPCWNGVIVIARLARRPPPARQASWRPPPTGAAPRPWRAMLRIHDGLRFQ